MLCKYSELEQQYTRRIKSLDKVVKPSWFYKLNQTNVLFRIIYQYWEISSFVDRYVIKDLPNNDGVVHAQKLLLRKCFLI